MWARWMYWVGSWLCRQAGRAGQRRWPWWRWQVRVFSRWGSVLMHWQYFREGAFRREARCKGRRRKQEAMRRSGGSGRVVFWLEVVLAFLTGNKGLLMRRM